MPIGRAKREIREVRERSYRYRRERGVINRGTLSVADTISCPQSSYLPTFFLSNKTPYVLVSGGHAYGGSMIHPQAIGMKLD